MKDKGAGFTWEKAICSKCGKVLGYADQDLGTTTMEDGDYSPTRFLCPICITSEAYPEEEGD